jgi:DNA-binding CsgD family transcriptional regulator
MAPHLNLLVLVLAVATGLVTATFSGLLVHSRRTAFFRYFLASILLFNLLVLAGLVYRYVELQLRQPDAPVGPELLPVLLAIMVLPKLAWLYAFLSMAFVAPGEDLPSWFHRRFGALAALIFVAWVGLPFVGRGPGGSAIAEAVGVVTEVAVLGGALAGCVYLLFRAGSAPAGSRRLSLRILGGGYLVVLGVMTLSVTLGWLRVEGQSARQVLFNSAVIVVYNLFSLAWILRFQPLGSSAEPAALERYGITPREREIIELIGEGHTNQEIAEKLFISVATVKDHNSNIFRKTGVRNRVELANLFRGRGSARRDEGGQPSAKQ